MWGGSYTWRCTSVIPATWEGGGDCGPKASRGKKYKTLCEKQTKSKRIGGILERFCVKYLVLPKKQKNPPKNPKQMDWYPFVPTMSGEVLFVF
jgi:hypothetical protein